MLKAPSVGRFGEVYPVEIMLRLNTLPSSSEKAISREIVLWESKHTVDHLRKLLPELLRMSPLLGMVVVQTWSGCVRLFDSTRNTYGRSVIEDASDIFRLLK